MVFFRVRRIFRKQKSPLKESGLVYFFTTLPAPLTKEEKKLKR
ncbi:hypothetical protein LBBP_02320 [Leptospira borgpetersenii serovar Ballum]|uniref:Uncharacterized protein n=1 Tax=Leptospira borgpetersenii serovar Ballum TaxID=280505 RepID=A0A0S2ISE4_LEPBO|nr:hypothetical protein LBBP_02320 [Leptospira borgpetersenii serovar Ballum]